METFTQISAMLILLTAFALVANKRVRSYIRTFRVQSLLIAAVAGYIGARELAEGGRPDVLVLCAVIIALKVVYIPGLLHRSYAQVEYRVEKDFFWNIPIMVLVSGALVLFTWFTAGSLAPSGETAAAVTSGVSLVLIGAFFMISRRKAIGQIVGFLVIENGIYFTALSAASGMPFVVDIGIFIDLVTGVIIMGILVFRISEKFDSIDIDRLRKLRG